MEHVICRYIRNLFRNAQRWFCVWFVPGLSERPASAEQSCSTPFRRSWLAKILRLHDLARQPIDSRASPGSGWPEGHGQIARTLLPPFLSWVDSKAFGVLPRRAGGATGHLGKICISILRSDRSPLVDMYTLHERLIVSRFHRSFAGYGHTVDVVEDEPSHISFTKARRGPLCSHNARTVER